MHRQRCIEELINHYRRLSTEIPPRVSDYRVRIVFDVVDIAAVRRTSVRIRIYRGVLATGQTAPDRHQVFHRWCRFFFFNSQKNTFFYTRAHFFTAEVRFLFSLANDCTGRIITESIGSSTK